MDEDAYVFETFDFVQEPGFLEASPKLVESVEKESVEENVNMAEDMNRSFLEELTSSRNRIQDELKVAQAAQAIAEAKLGEMSKQYETLKRKEDVVQISEKLQVVGSDMTRLPRIMEDFGFKNFGELVRFVEAIDPKDVVFINKGGIAGKMKVLEEFQTKVARTQQEGISVGRKASEMIAEYRKHGTTAEVAAKLESLAKTDRALEVLGKPEDIRTALRESTRLLEKYKELGTPQQVEKALTMSLTVLEDYKGIGTPSKIREALEKSEQVLGRLAKFGGFARIKQVVEKYNKSVRTRREEMLSERSEELSKKHRMPVTEVRKLVEKVGFEEADTLMSSIHKSPGRVTETFVSARPVAKAAVRNNGMLGAMFESASRQLGK